MAIDKIIKSNRLLQSRRYTVASLTDSQESFTSVLDINSGEVYTQTNLIPTSSLPFSGSSQSGSIFSVGGEPILKYYYRQAMTPSNVVSGSFTDAFFFIDPPPGGTVTPQLLQNGQQNNFISAKYSSPSLANSDAEDSPPGYNAVVFIAGVKQNPANYQFDYKNGVLEFLTSPPTTGQAVSITAYQYVGKTLNTLIATGFSGSFSGSFQGTATLNNLTLTGSFNQTGSYNLVGNITQTGSFNQSGSRTIIGNITQTGSLNQSGSINVVGAIISNGINVVDNAIAMAIALG